MVNDTLNDALNGTLNELKNDKNITQKELVEKTGMSLRTIKRNIKKLKEKGYIERIGSKKIGYWKVIK